MGKKDFQQFFFVKKFIENKYKSKVISCKTIRDDNKLALSSRNYLFNKKELNIAGKISKQIFNLKKSIKYKKNINNFLLNEKIKLQKIFKIKIEYLELRKEKNLMTSNTFINSKIFVSYYFKGVRLIDNF